jgi:hypothetical protein
MSNFAKAKIYQFDNQFIIKLSDDYIVIYGLFGVNSNLTYK